MPEIIGEDPLVACKEKTFEFIGGTLRINALSTHFKRNLGYLAMIVAATAGVFILQPFSKDARFHTVSWARTGPGSIQATVQILNESGKTLSGKLHVTATEPTSFTISGETGNSENIVAQQDVEVHVPAHRSQQVAVDLRFLPTLTKPLKLYARFTYGLTHSLSEEFPTERASVP